MRQEERRAAQHQDAQDLERREQRLRSRALADAARVDRRQENDRRRPHAELRVRRQPERLAEVEREHARDRGDHRRLDHPQIRPAEDEAPQVAEGLADEDVESAGARVRDRELGQNERPGEREQPAQDPGAEHERQRAELLRDRMRRAEDPRADDVADGDRGGGVEADLAQRQGGCGRAGLGHGHVGNTIPGSAARGLRLVRRTGRRL
jgi:hypothetical protein